MKTNYGQANKSNKYKKDKVDLAKQELEELKKNALKNKNNRKVDSKIEEISNRNDANIIKDVTKITTKNKKWAQNLTLAEKWGLVDTPAKPLSVEEWATIEARTTQQELHKLHCPICLEGYGVDECVLLSCGHGFHSACLDGFERCSRTKKCPICRRSDYDKKTWVGCNDYYLNSCATHIQKNFKMYVCFKEFINKVSLPTHVFTSKEAGYIWRMRVTDFKNKINNIKFQNYEKYMDKQLEDFDKQVQEYKKKVAQLEQLAENRFESEHQPDWEVVKQKCISFGQNECVICQNEFHKTRKIAILDCGHIFHINCYASYERYTLGIKKCPLCRQEVHCKRELVYYDYE